MEKIFQALGSSMKDVHGLEQIAFEVLEDYKQKMITEFNQTYRGQIENILRTYGEELDPLSQEVYSAILEDKYQNAVSVVITPTGEVQAVVDPAFALVAAILEYGNTDIPPMPHWSTLEKRLVNEGIGIIVAKVREKFAGKMNDFLRKVRA